MLQKYTKFCTAQILIKAIQSPEKDEVTIVQIQQTMHILLSVFKKSLNWIEEKYSREGLLDAIPKITVKKGIVNEQLSWIYVIKESFTFHNMPFYMSQYTRFVQPAQNYLSFSEQGLYAVLTNQNCNQLQQLHEKRERQKIQRFVKVNMFYPYYLEDHHVKEFITLVRIKKLGYNKVLNWKDEDKSNKIAVILKGLVSIQYQWKRKIQVAQLTRGMYLANHYIKDMLEQIQDYELEKVQQQPNLQYFPKFKFVSKSDETVLLIFNARLIRETPYNINPELIPNIKNHFQKYITTLQNTIGFSSRNKLHRNKSSIKEQLKKRKQKEVIKRDISLQVNNLSRTASPSPIVRTYATLELQSNPFDTIKSIDLPQPVKSYSKTALSVLPIKSPQRLARSKTTDIEKALSNGKLIHNTWVEQMANQKKRHVKSFSTLQNLTTYDPQRSQKQQALRSEIQAPKKPQFFVPDQFVKRKLKLKYEGLVGKMRNMDLTIHRTNQQSVVQKMHRLQDYIDSKRIVKLNNAKRKFKLLRDKVQY